MPWWLLTICIAGGIVLALIALVVLFGVLPAVGRAITSDIEDWRYVQKASKRNEEARKLRITRSDWEGIPMPMGNSGYLVIPDRMIQDAEPRVVRQIDQVLVDRMRDLGVAYESMHDPVTNDIHIRWARDPKKMPKNPAG